MKSIYEVKEDIKTLSKDFELVKSGPESSVRKRAKAFLKELDARAEALGLNYEQCREAARLFKKGNFRGALEKIWGKSKVKVETINAEAGSISKITYTVKDYATFTEMFIRKGINNYIHKIEGVYNDNLTPSYPLGTVLRVEEKFRGLDFEEQLEHANKSAYMAKSTASIYNILFVNYDDYDLSSILSKYHIKLKTKL